MAVTTAEPLGSRPQVGELLRAWRQRRSLSQLELALEADVSSRHVSFLETGRSRPSRDMVLHLAEHLEVPLRDRNGLLLAAGYAPVYAERELQTPEMEPVRQALDRFLRAHEPFPAVVVDRHYNLVSANDAVALLTEGVAPVADGASRQRAADHAAPRGDGAAHRQPREWSAHLLHRLRRQATVTGDPELEALYEELAAYPGVATEVAPDDGADIVLPMRLREGDGELSFFSTISTFGTAVDITLAELAIEAFYPANARTAARLLRDIGADNM